MIDALVSLMLIYIVGMLWAPFGEQIYIRGYEKLHGVRDSEEEVLITMLGWPILALVLVVLYIRIFVKSISTRG